MEIKNIQWLFRKTKMMFKVIISFICIWTRVKVNHSWREPWPKNQFLLKERGKFKDNDDRSGENQIKYCSMIVKRWWWPSGVNNLCGLWLTFVFSVNMSVKILRRQTKIYKKRKTPMWKGKNCLQNQKRKKEKKKLPLKC